jgi:hypothetical protein
VREPPPSLTTTLEDAIGAVLRIVRREVVRLVAQVVITCAGIVVACTVACSWIISGSLRIGDALALICARWLGDVVLGNLIAGLAMVALPLIGLCVLSWIFLRRANATTSPATPG